MERAVLAQNNRIIIRKTTPKDVPYILKQERDPSNMPFIGQWSGEQHLAAIDNDDCGHWMVEARSDARPVGFVILRGLINPHRNIEFMRIAISEKAQGFGRATLQVVKHIVFDQLEAHRLWLDVQSHNTRARALYESEGFVVEGTLRECLKHGETYHSLIVLSLLEQEWREQKKAVTE